MFLARRVARRHHRTRGPVAVEAAKTIQSVFRAQKTREIAAEREIRWQTREELWEVQRQNETSRTQRERRGASIAIQAAWRAAIGRAEGAERARRKLRAVLVDLGGGQGRMHRYVAGRLPTSYGHTAEERRVVHRFMLQALQGAGENSVFSHGRIRNADVVSMLNWSCPRRPTSPPNQQHLFRLSPTAKQSVSTPKAQFVAGRVQPCLSLHFPDIYTRIAVVPRLFSSAR